MKVDQDFLTFLQKHEGFEPAEYPDSGGYPSIGIGHKLTQSELSSGKIRIAGTPVRYQNGLSDDQIYELCRQDTRIASDCVNNSVIVPLSQTQFNVLVSFTFNVGTGAFEDSTLLKRLNMGLYTLVPSQLIRWIHCRGKIDKGLVNRRNAEVALWNS